MNRVTVPVTADDYYCGFRYKYIKTVRFQFREFFKMYYAII